jgi:hypothetical protein
MAFTATIQSINPSPSPSGVNFTVGVLFNDSVTGFKSLKTYNFPSDTTQAAAVTAITADGQAIKTQLASLSNLQGKVGQVITI